MSVVVVVYWKLTIVLQRKSGNHNRQAKIKLEPKSAPANLKFSSCKCQAACPTTAADHLRTRGHSDHAPGHKDVLQSRSVKSGNTHTASNCWPCRFCNAVENRTGLCSSGSVEHHPILAPNCKGADSSLTGLFLYADKQRLLDILCGHTLHSLLLAVTVDVS